LLLDNHKDIVVLLTGSPKERLEVDEVALIFKDNRRCVNVAGDLEFDDLIPLYSISDGMLTNDSGPGHFASALGLRTFVLFGPETPALYGPLRNATAIYAGLACSPCVYATNHRDTPCTDNQCLKVIPPAFVYSLVSDFLLKKSATLSPPIINYTMDLS
jgi:ADP-heptose:LPS heptosyltransferase